MTGASVVSAPGLRARRSRAGPVAMWSAGQSTRSRLGLTAFLALMVAVAVISVISLILALRWVDRPFPGILLNERVIAGNVGRYEWTGTFAGLRYPDRLVEANGIPIRTVHDLDEIVRSVASGTPIIYRVDRRGEIFNLTIPTMRFTWIDLLLTFGVTFGPGVIFCGLGASVFLLKPNTSVSWAFLLTCVCLGLYGIVAFDVQSTHWGFVRLFLLVRAFLPAAITHLSLVFPERREWVDKRSWVVASPYAISTILTVIIQALYPKPAHMVPAAIALVYLFLSTAALVTSSIIAIRERMASLARERAKVVLFGAAAAFPIPALGHYLSLAQDTAIQINFLAIPLLIFPAAIAYAIARHDLFDVDVYIKRALGYGIMTGLVALGYFAMQTLAGTIFVESILGSSGQRVYPFVLGLLVVFFFNPLDRRIQAMVARLFFRQATDYKKTVSAVSDALTSMLNRDQIVRQVLGAIKHPMALDAAGVIARDRQRNIWQSFFVSDRRDAAGVESETATTGEVPSDDPLLGLLSEEKKLLTAYDIEEDPAYADVREACLRRFTETGARLAVPLIYHGHVTGALAVGQKKSGHFYNREDIDLLGTMANQAAVAIENATTHEEVVRYAEELSASLRRIQILESIKSNLSKFVPRTVQALIEESPEAPSFEKREADVSVLFADITGYTRLSSQLPIDEVNQLVERYFGAFLDEIVRRGGDVNETAGDGLMVIFQNPDPVQHARAAVETGLAIRRRTLEINDQHRGRYEPIEMHIGVHSGVAAVGATRIEGGVGARWTYTASGSTTNIASRLTALSEGGVLVISDETRRRLGDGFVLEDLGPKSLKNVPMPIRAHRVLSGRAAQEVRPDERRRYARHRLPWRVTLWVGEQHVVADVIDASLYGLSISRASSLRVELNAVCRVEVETGVGVPVVCEGIVRHISDACVGIETKETLPVG
jgi:class 3 adenylate cyclase/GAF domain-containing protein